jgi:hypothetical protein
MVASGRFASEAAAHWRRARGKTLSNRVCPAGISCYEQWPAGPDPL